MIFERIMMLVVLGVLVVICKVKARSEFIRGYESGYENACQDHQNEFDCTEVGE